MKRKILLLLMVPVLSLHGCVSSQIKEKEILVKIETSEITAVPSPDQKIGFDKTITSKKKNLVSLSPYEKLKLNAFDKIMFMLSIRNCGEGAIDINYDNISVAFEDGAGNGGTYEINVQHLDDVMNDFEEKTRWNEIAFIGGAVGKYPSRSHMMLTAEEKWGYDITPKYDEMDLHGDRMVLEMMHEQNQKILEAMPDFIMSRQVIMPGDSYSGVVVCDNVDLVMEGTFIITVSFDGERHTFAFDRSFGE